jgi:hypothetical protein
MYFGFVANHWAIFRHADDENVKDSWENHRFINTFVESKRTGR